MEDLVLSIEQCKHLLELGLDMSDAKMCWSPFWNKKEEEDKWMVLELPNDKFLRHNIKKGLSDCEIMEIIPTYTLQEILGKLPKEIIVTSPNTNFLELHINIFDGIIYYWSSNHEWEHYIVHIKNDILKASYEMLCWVIENGHLKTK